MSIAAEIECKYCGCCGGDVHKGKGPHAYEIKCSGCDRHYKWASALDIEHHTSDKLQEMLILAEPELSEAKQQDSWPLMKAAEKRITKIKQKLEKL